MATPEQRTVKLKVTFESELTLSEAGFKQAEERERQNSFILDRVSGLDELEPREIKMTIAQYILTEIGISSMHGDYSGKNPMICLSSASCPQGSDIEAVSFGDPYVELIDGEDVVDIGVDA